MWTDLGFLPVASCEVGDVVLYTLGRGHGLGTVGEDMEAAWHYGVVRHIGSNGGRAVAGAVVGASAPSHVGVWVESKIGSDERWPTYLHPLHVVRQPASERATLSSLLCIALC